MTTILQAINVYNCEKQDLQMGKIPNDEQMPILQIVHLIFIWG